MGAAVVGLYRAEILKTQLSCLNFPALSSFLKIVTKQQFVMIFEREPKAGKFKQPLVLKCAL